MDAICHSVFNENDELLIQYADRFKYFVYWKDRPVSKALEDLHRSLFGPVF